MEIPDGFEPIEANVYRKDDVLLIVLPGLTSAISIRLVSIEEAFGQPPPGFEWTGEVRPPLKGEYFWSDLKGTVVQAIKDETGMNQFGEPTGGRKILRPAGQPAEAPKTLTAVEKPKPVRSHLRLVKEETKEETTEETNEETDDESSGGEKDETS